MLPRVITSTILQIFSTVRVPFQQDVLVLNFTIIKKTYVGISKLLGHHPRIICSISAFTNYQLWLW